VYQQVRKNGYEPAPLGSRRQPIGCPPNGRSRRLADLARRSLSNVRDPRSPAPLAGWEEKRSPQLEQAAALTHWEIIRRFAGDHEGSSYALSGLAPNGTLPQGSAFRLHPGLNSCAASRLSNLLSAVRIQVLGCIHRARKGNLDKPAACRALKRITTPKCNHMSLTVH